MLSLCQTRFASLTAIKGGQSKTINFEEGTNLFELLVDNGMMSKDQTCQGNIGCGKCTIGIKKGKLPPPIEEEDDILPKDGKRLACAITLTKAQDGIEIEV
ncbi:Ferredoxin 3 [Trichomonas vaginalis G3]|uniref:Ferredoxin 3 n=1 Tax=Trichomonas vaginalis (strain ATCC PRA-98 / G3) TaxID=412133 RepID=A2EET9_TRIV3|nr:ferredoxin family [Trichomonas vaginalis G3]EAY08805.1 Ferredoxin 3 [Trichomonas vaginalis G3]KAI5542025.1 ferredoxin family [Trichomonas vaginalis G3]|eukprot:XP_001321028.1 Ferredoxin 3 [Trichomonas vaginalis G3]